MARSQTKQFIRSIALLLLLAAALTARAERLPIKVYTTADGLAHNRIGGILRDSRGLLWLSTAGGLSRFDGARFTTYNLKDGLPSLTINSLLETRAGKFWAATNNDGVAYLDGNAPSNAASDAPARGSFTAYAISDDPTTNRVNALFEDRAGGLWAGTDGGLFCSDKADGNFHRVGLEIPEHADRQAQVWAFAEDNAGSLWIATKFGLVARHGDGRMIHYGIESSPNSDQVLALLKDGNGNLWAAHESGIIVFNPASMPVASGNLLGLARRYTTAEGLGDNRIRTLYQGANGRIWAAGASLNEFDGSAFQTYPLKAFLGIDFINTLAEDTDGNLWLGTNASGALRFVRQGFVSFDASDGLGPVISSVFENRAGELYVEGYDWRVSRFDGKGFTTVRPNLPKNITGDGWRARPTVLEDSAGHWWVGTRVGLFRFPKVDRFEQLASTLAQAVYTRKDGLIDDDIVHLFEDSRGDLWITSISPGRDVITRWDRATETFHHYGEAEGLRPFIAPISFSEDRDGNLWIGFREGGLAVYRDGRFRVLAENEGFPNGSPTRVYVDRAGRLWCTVGNHGLWRIDQPQAATPEIIKYTRQEGLSDPSYTFLTEDGQGRIYTAVPRGVDRLDPTNGSVKHYTPSEGLAIGELTSTFCDRSGALWFGTNRGLSRFVPQAERPSQPPLIFIDGLRVAGNARSVSPLGEREIAALEMGPNQNQLEIYFFGMSFEAGENLRYEYKLEGASDDWAAPTEQRGVNFANLAPGGYRFLVRAVNSYGLTSQSPAVVRFHILPPVWRRWWFVLLVTLTLSGVALAFARYRYLRIKAVREAQEDLRRSREERLVELERVRRRIATDLHDDIGSSLTQISLLSEVVRRKVAGVDGTVSKPLSEMASMSRELVDAMSDIVWAINPQKDHLRDLLQRMRHFASQVFIARQIDFTFQSPDALADMAMGANVRRELYLIFKEGVNNMVRHSGCTRAEIECRADADSFYLRLSDNGHGFDTSLHRHGHGLMSMRERSEGLGGELAITSAVGEGTTLVLTLPLAHKGPEVAPAAAQKD